MSDFNPGHLVVNGNSMQFKCRVMGATLAFRQHRPQHLEVT